MRAYAREFGEDEELWGLVGHPARPRLRALSGPARGHPRMALAGARAARLPGLDGAGRRLARRLPGRVARHRHGEDAVRGRRAVGLRPGRARMCGPTGIDGMTPSRSRRSSRRRRSPPRSTATRCARAPRSSAWTSTSTCVRHRRAGAARGRARARARLRGRSSRGCRVRHRRRLRGRAARGWLIRWRSSSSRATRPARSCSTQALRVLDPDAARASTLELSSASTSRSTTARDDRQRGRPRRPRGRCGRPASA